MNSKLLTQVKKLYNEYGYYDLKCALAKFEDKEVWNNMDHQQREDFFVEQCQDLGLTIKESEGGLTLTVVDFVKKQDHPNPYFMFWRQRNSDGQKAGIEFGHWHWNRKWDKQYPHTEYCFYGPKAHRQLMEKYVLENNQ